MAEAVEPAVLAAAFGHALHDAGVPGTPERAVRFARALALAPPTTRDELYWTARVIYVSSREELPAFDAVFAQVFDGMRDVADGRGDPNAPPPIGAEPGRPRPPGSGAGRVARERRGSRRSRFPVSAAAGTTAMRASRPCSPRRARTSGCTTRASTRSTPKSWWPCASSCASWRSAPRRDARAAAHGPSDAASGSTCAPRCAASRRTAGDPLHLARRRRRERPAGWWCCATSRARWSPTRARSSSFSTARWPAATPRRSCSPRG